MIENCKHGYRPSQYCEECEREGKEKQPSTPERSKYATGGCPMKMPESKTDAAGHTPVGITELLSCRCFDADDREAIDHVTMLLTEYAWSKDPMTAPAQELKDAMQKVWKHWQARHANAAGERQPPANKEKR